MKKDNETATILWQPNIKFQQQSRLYRYMKWLKNHYKLQFDNYPDLWQWSVDNPADFWASVWQYFEIKAYSPYKTVMSETPMPHTKWFEGATLNYAEHIFLGKTDFSPAIKFASENQALEAISWSDLEKNVAAVAYWLKSKGVKKGDRIVAYLPNIPEAVIAFLATVSLGAIWSSCSPDFGTSSVVERFKLIEPKIIFAVDGYQYAGKPFDKVAAVQEILNALPTLERIVMVPCLNKNIETLGKLDMGFHLWNEILLANETDNPKLQFTPVDFSHPIYILYSSGTTGAPKAITHSHGGILLEHFKYMAFHNNVKAGESFFWYTTTGWMMWNFAVSSLLMGATLILYDGSPTYPDKDCLWTLSDAAAIAHFGTSAAYLTALMKADYQVPSKIKLKYLISIGSTGSPLPPEAYEYVYSHIKKDVWLSSMAGGTDICTAWVGGNPLMPVYKGEIQCRCLGCDMASWDEMGHDIINEVGEMVVRKAMPSMPVFFWNDPDFEKYKASYFETYANIWRHGDWLIVTDRQTVIIQGRSDATLNRHGIRIGTAEIYRVIDTITDIKDSLIVNLELSGGRHYMPLFVVLTEGVQMSDALKQKINKSLRDEYSPRHVPDDIIAINDIPYTISGKKMEAPVKKILMGIPLSKAANEGAMRNPESLTFFVNFSHSIQSKS